MSDQTTAPVEQSEQPKDVAQQPPKFSSADGSYYTRCETNIIQHFISENKL